MEDWKLKLSSAGEQTAKFVQSAVRSVKWILPISTSKGREDNRSWRSRVLSRVLTANGGRAKYAAV